MRMRGDSQTMLEPLSDGLDENNNDEPFEDDFGTKITI